MWHNKVLQNCQSKCNKTTLKLCLAMYHNALLLMSMLSIDQSIYGITLKMKASLGILFRVVVQSIHSTFLIIWSHCLQEHITSFHIIEIFNSFEFWTVFVLSPLWHLFLFAQKPDNLGIKFIYYVWLKYDPKANRSQDIYIFFWNCWGYRKTFLPYFVTEGTFHPRTHHYFPTFKYFWRVICSAVSICN